jgi:hypothetical protein
MSVSHCVFFQSLPLVIIKAAILGKTEFSIDIDASFFCDTGVQ